MFFEYLNALNTLKTLNVLNNLNIFNSLYPLAITVSEGKIDNKSIIAITENGYKINDLAPRFNFLSAVNNLKM